uniref:Uncharacterized protein n=1 Tax=Kalanchoe fedtschenkoi TaxID=63787 RepID=A0A7N0UL98_KALFE
KNGVQLLSHPDLTGPDNHQPVIHPPTRAGGIRCSVKPAWRGSLAFKAIWAQAFARARRATPVLDRASRKPIIRPDPSSPRTFPLFNASLDYRPALPDPAIERVSNELINSGIIMITFDVG